MKSEPNTFDVVHFNDTTFASLFIDENNIQKEVIINKNHYKYLYKYLNSDRIEGSEKTQTFVIEHDYISKSFLHDYSNYYSLCFNNKIRKKCKRVHFFSSDFDKAKFIKEIHKKDSKIINCNNYLGYIVTNDVPDVMIETAVLKTYKDSNKNYILKQYKINLFGRTLILNSLAFKQQDQIISACATSALWACFHKTSQLFQTKLPTPSEITLSAKNQYSHSGRIFPSIGLDHYQVGNVIESVGLVHELRNRKSINELKFFKAFISAYSALQIPILIGVQIGKKSDNYHLIALSGTESTYEHNNLNNKDLNLYSNDMSFIYAHDDRLGPFSKIKLVENRDKEIILEILTPDNLKWEYYVSSLIVPIYEKIRIKFEDIYGIVYKTNLFFKKKVETTMLWDIVLMESNEYKTQIFKYCSDEIKNKILFTSLPKYVWIVRAFVKDVTVFEMIFDTTDLARGFYCLLINIYDLNLLQILKDNIDKNDVTSYVKEEFGDQFFNLLNTVVATRTETV